MTTALQELRSLTPVRPLRMAEGLRVAELQAARLLAASGIEDGPVPDEIITDLPRIQVEHLHPLGVSGFSQWAKGRWLIGLNAAEPTTRQRFSMAHEFKHILDSPYIAVLYPTAHGQDARQRAELICDHFAGCLLMPRPWVKRAWREGQRDAGHLARRFDVSRPAMEVRLRQIGLTERQRTRHLAVA